MAASGREWIVDAAECDPAALASLPALQGLFSRIIADLALRPVGGTDWHVFPAPGGITGLCLLAESHLTVHTFPEHGALCLNLFCCTPRPECDFARLLADTVGAARVDVRSVRRAYANVSALPARA